MDGEFVFSVASNTATPATPITLAEAGLKERDHLQEWVIAHPEILGPGVLVITSEFDRWQSKAGPERHRPDVIGLDGDGRLVVAELKRDAAPDTVDMQAIKYAATASRFDVDTLAAAHADYLKRSGGEVLASRTGKRQDHRTRGAACRDGGDASQAAHRPDRRILPDVGHRDCGLANGDGYLNHAYQGPGLPHRA